MYIYSNEAPSPHLWVFSSAAITCGVQISYNITYWNSCTKLCRLPNLPGVSCKRALFYLGLFRTRDLVFTPDCQKPDISDRLPTTANPRMKPL